MLQRRVSTTDPISGAFVTMGPFVTMDGAGRFSAVTRLLSGKGLVNSDRNEFIAWVPACAVPVPASPDISFSTSTNSLGDANRIRTWNGVGSASIAPTVLMAVLMAPATAMT